MPQTFSQIKNYFIFIVLLIVCFIACLVLISKKIQANHAYGANYNYSSNTKGATITHATLEDNFCGQSFIIVIDYAAIYNNVVVNLLDDFNEFYIYDLSEYSESNQTLKIKLQKYCRQNILNVIQKFYGAEGILYVEPNFLGYFSTTTPNDPHFIHGMQWALTEAHGINILPAWAWTTGSHDIRVGVVDTGIAPHEDLNANLVAGRNTVDNNYDTNDTHRHGTNIAGIIGAVTNNEIGIAGVAQNVSLVPLKIANGEVWTTSRMVQAINWANNNNVHILNISGFTVNSSALHTAVRNFNGLIVTSADNDARIVHRAPATFSQTHNNVITVGSINDEGNRARHSNYGDAVNIFAPGVMIITTCISDEIYQLTTGTSVAAPHVAGVAALMLSVNPTLTPSQLRALIVQSGREITIHAPTLGYHSVRVLDAYNAVKAAMFTFEQIAGTDNVSISRRLGAVLPTEFEPPTQVFHNGAIRTVAQIGIDGFANANLTTVTIPSTIQAIAADAFNENLGLATVNFGSNFNLRHIGHGAFAFTNINQISLPPSLESVGVGAFYATPLFDSQTGIVYVSNWIVGTRGTFSSHITLSPNTVGIADHAFDHFFTQSGLLSINLSNSLRFIGAGAFKNAPLSQITLPASLEQINSAAFMGSNIQRVVANRTTGAWPHQITQLVGTEHFAHTPANLTILVPACSYSAYRANHNWRNLNLRIYGSRTDVYINSTHQEILINFNQKGHIYNGRYYTDLRVRFMLQMNAFFSIAGYGAAAYVYNNTGTARLGVAYSGSNGTASVYNQTGQEVIVRLRLCALRGQNARLIINHAITNHGSNVNMGTYLNRDINIIYNSSSNPNSYNSLLFAPTVSGWYNFILWIGSTAESGGFYVYDMNDASIRHEVTQIHTQRTSIHLLAGRTYLLLVYARAFRSSVRAFNIYLTTPTSNPNPTTPSTQTATIDTYLSSVTLPSTRWQWVTPNAFLNTAGTHAFRARYTPSDSERYHIIYRDVIVSVVYRAPIFTTPTGLAAELGQLLHEINLPTNWTWTSPNTVVSTTGTPRFRARFSCGTPRTRPAYSYITLNVARPYIIPSGLTAEPSQYLRDLTLPTGWTWANPDTPVGAVGNRSFAARFTTNTQTPLVVNYNLSVRVTIFEQNRQLIFSGTLASPAIDIVGPPGEIIGPGFPVNPPLLPGLPPLLPGLPPPGVTPPPLLPPVYRPLNDCCADLYYDLEYSMSVVISCQCADGYMCACDNCACPRVFPPICECFFVGICTCPNCICGPIVFLPPEPCPPPSMAIPFTGSLSDIFNRSLYINISTIRSEVISTENSAFNNMHRFTFRDLVGFTQLSLDSISTRPIVICALSNSTLTITIESRRGLRDCGTTLESKLYTRATINTPHTNWTAPTNIWLV